MADEAAKRIAEFIEPLRVKPGSKVTLAKDFDPAFKAGFVKKKDGLELLQRGVELMAEYQERLAAQDTYGVVVVLQALDAAGKDGTIRHVMSGVNPQGVSVHSFKVPSAEEINHDYLWRYARALPGRGEIGIFNRSHYEEVLVVRVHPENLERQRLPKEARGRDVWKRRYRDINDWERHLADNGFKIVKLLLNLSQEEQRVRFLRRIDLPDHNWKFSAADARERTYWDDYQKAFSEMLSATEHRLGALVRDPRRPQVVRAHLRLGGDRQRPDRDRPALPEGDRRGAQGAAGDQGRARGAGAQGGRPRPVRRPERRRRPEGRQEGRQERRQEGHEGREGREEVARVGEEAGAPLSKPCTRVSRRRAGKNFVRPKDGRWRQVAAPKSRQAWSKRVSDWWPAAEDRTLPCITHV